VQAFTYENVTRQVKGEPSAIGMADLEHIR